MDEPPAGLVEVGRYERLSIAREHGLVLSAMAVNHWIVRDQTDFTLQVELSEVERATAELLRYGAEREPLESPERISGIKFEPYSLYVAVWGFALVWWLQSRNGAPWLERGQADSQLILQGQWWRTFTALCLHGDGPHLIANLASALLFAGFLLPRFGGGLTWLLIIVCGGLGNALNAIFYASVGHSSIGASTAVFGALGLLVGAEFLARLKRGRGARRWQLIVPLGAGLGLLAFLGSGDGHGRTDLMAHFWGFLVGIPVGAAFAHWENATLPLRQKLAGGAACLLLTGAWLLALRF